MTEMIPLIRFATKVMVITLHYAHSSPFLNIVQSNYYDGSSEFHFII